MRSSLGEFWYRAVLREVSGFRSYRTTSDGRRHWLWSFLGVRVVEALTALARWPRPFGRS